VGYRWGHSEDTVRLEAALRAALAARGVPQRIYVDNGSAFVDSQLLRACASLGIDATRVPVRFGGANPEPTAWEHLSHDETHE
jgi:transposase InsO family protein